LLKQRRDFDNWRTVEQTDEDENPRLGRFLGVDASQLPLSEIVAAMGLLIKATLHAISTV
jgi:hypothetical protein